MPRGEETQEPIQEEPQASREVKAQDEVKEQEAKRDQEVVAEPEAVVEHERPVAESEAIEAAVVEAVEAVEAVETTADRGPETGDGAEVSLSPDDVKEDGRPGTGDRQVDPSSSTGEDTEGKLPEEDIRNQPGSGGGEVAATPINLPDEADNPDPIFDQAQADAAVRTAGQEPGGDVAATPINLPNVAEEPTHGPNPVSETANLEGAELDQVLRDDDPPPPPDRNPDLEDPDLRLPEKEVQNQPGSGGGEVAATPINLPNVAEDPDHGPNPFTNSSDIDLSALEGADPEMELAEEDLGEEGHEILDETAFKVESPLPEGEILQEIDPGLSEGEVETAEQDPDAPLEGSEQVPPEDLKENEKAQDIKNANELGLGWYVYEDSDGNQTVVDADGNPVKSPPVLIKYQGKTYATYPGDKPAIDETGVIQDPSKLIELSGYETSVEKMFLHEHSDGSVTVVDKDGNPIPSQPSVITYQGKKYIGYPGQDLGIDEKGNITDPIALKAHEASYYKQPTDGMFIHDDGQGNLTVVDEKGNPVSSQPAIISYEGKNYIVYPGQDLGIDAQGKVIDLNALKSHEASYYKAPTDGMFLHDDGNGNLTAVDETGKPVASQPTIITHEGKKYIVYPGQDAGIDDQGKITDPNKLKAHEASYFKQSTAGMSIHDDGKGNLTVVDEDGKPVDSQPKIVTYQGKQYLIYPGQETGIDNTGKVTDPKALKDHEASYYQKSTRNMFLHDDGKGNYTVVDGDGQPVDSPPIIVEKDGKVYATYPGWDDGIDNTGKVTDPKKLQQLEISFYKPPWWQKKGIS